MSPEIAIRAFAEQDAFQVCELFILVNRMLSPPNMRDAFESYITRSSIQEMDRIVAYYGERDGGFWVALSEDTVVGMFGLERVFPHALELRRMYVAPSVRRNGIARRMLLDAEAECRPADSKARLSTSELQDAALALYQRAGYALVREETTEESSNKTLGEGNS